MQNEHIWRGTVGLLYLLNQNLPTIYRDFAVLDQLCYGCTLYPQGF